MVAFVDKCVYTICRFPIAIPSSQALGNAKVLVLWKIASVLPHHLELDSCISQGDLRGFTSALATARHSIKDKHRRTN